MKYTFLLVFIFLFGCTTTNVKNEKTKVTELKNFTQKYEQNILRGSNTEFRNWWNVLHYNLNVSPNFEEKFISGTIDIAFEIIDNPKNLIMQIDLQEPMQITKISKLNNSELNIEKMYWERNKNTYFIDLSQFLKNQQKHTLRFYFEGHPRIAKNAPWDGGWVFTKDEKNRPWMSAAVQGLGASAWFPNKDFQGDEPDNGMTFTLNVPQNLVAVANGKLTPVKNNENNSYTWEVKSPINNYSIIPYIGYYENFTDVFNGEGGELSLDYWVLDYNIDKAKKHFEQVKPMMTAFEDWMGKYPFYEDGFKLVESPYLGMEHQSGIAYGNYFMNGYYGSDISGTGWGNKFDYIIVHETGHEWFGNSITTKDIADMWVHEGFTMYTEVMYVENMFGKKAANEYIKGLRRNIRNDKNIIGEYGINQEGSSDMYYKGANMIHTLRQLMEDDVKFKQMIRDINKTYYHQVVTGKQIEDFISEYKGVDLTDFFNQYLRSTMVPTLETKKREGKTYFRWTNIVEGFDMPVKIANSNDWIFPNAEWKVYKGNAKLIVDDNFYVHQK